MIARCALQFACSILDAMRDAPAYSSDRFPADFVASLLCGVAASVISGVAIWFGARTYLQRMYPGRLEMNGAAVVAGVLDGALIGLGAFTATFAVRIWVHERKERNQSDKMLRAALDDIPQGGDGR